MCVNEIEGAEKLVSGGVGELGVGFSSDNVEATAVPENGTVKFTIMPKGGGEGTRRADACLTNNCAMGGG